MVRRSLACFIVALAFIASSVDMSAVSFKASLTSLKLYARPGQVLTQNFQLTLDKDQRATQFKARVEDWWRSEDGSQSFYAPAGTLTRSCGEWIALNPVEATVAPGATLSVRITISVPATVEPGGYWCVLTLDEVPDPLAQQQEVDVRFVASVSTGIFIYINPLERSAEILDVAVLPDRATVKLRNVGNTPVAVEGRFEFLPVGGSTPTAVVALPRGTLLPQPLRTGLFSADLPPTVTLPSGRYLVRAIVDIGLDHYVGVQRELDLRREANAAPRP